MKELLKHLAESLLIKIVFFNVFLLFLHNLCYADKSQYKAKINKNTQKRLEYGCKRPNWSEDEYVIDINGEESICIFNMRNVILYNTSIIEPQIEIKECYRNKQKKLCCKVLYGKWEVFDGGKNIIENDIKNLQIDHILPFSYIRLNMKNCKLTSQYFNFMDNLAVMYGKENLKKKDLLCQTKEECIKQKEICCKMSSAFNDNNLCDELNKIIIE